MITHHKLELESLNLHQTCFKAGIENRVHRLWPSRSFSLFWLRILGNLACSHDKSSQIWAGITKFAPNVHHEMLSADIENGGHWPWSSRSFRPSSVWLKILGNSACTHARFQRIWARITKFRPNMHLGILSAGIENGCHCPWPSRSFGHFASEFQDTSFNVTLVHWSRPAKGCYTSQMCSCLRLQSHLPGAII